MNAKKPLKEQPVVANRRRYWTILLSILLIGFAIKLIRLDVPKDFYFDEVYHGYTATLYVHGDADSYNMYAKNPPGKAIEWTHPPLAKLFMAASMEIFGENSFGWRFSSTVFGTLLIFFSAMLAWELFESQFIALTTAFLLTVEGLVFAQSRLAMNDAHVGAFTFMCLYFYIRWRKSPKNFKLLMLAGLGLGLALSCKWSALFVYFIVALERLASWWKSDRFVPPLKEIGWLAISFLVIPPIIYLLSYSHFFYLGYTWDDLIKLHQSMWWYHTNLKAGHPYKSVPWQWLLNLRPVWMYVDYSVPGYIGNIYNNGNSIILYFGLASVLTALGELKRKKWSWQLWFCIDAYFMVWLPWIFSPRIMLFYHYLPAVPTLCIVASRQLEKSWSIGRKKTVWIFLALCFLWFALFYPNETAIPVPRWFADSVYFIVPGWK